jgi:hypothetical protein
VEAAADQHDEAAALSNGKEIADRNATISEARLAHGNAVEKSRNIWTRYESLRVKRGQAHEAFSKLEFEERNCAALLAENSVNSGPEAGARSGTAVASRAADRTFPRASATGLMTCGDLSAPGYCLLGVQANPH